MIKIIVKCEIDDAKINEIIALEENTHLKSQEAIKNLFVQMLEESIIETIEDNSEIFTKVEYKIKQKKLKKLWKKT